MNHKELEVYEKLNRQCRRLQGKINMANLCLTVLGGKGAEVLSKAVNKCIKQQQKFKVHM